MDIEEARKKIQRYCTYQDRCHKEVRTKLIQLEVYGEDLEELLIEMISDEFLNEERFTRAYARGKFRIKGWGRIKIRQELSFRNIHDRLIQQVLKEEIEEEDYLASAEKIAHKKDNLIPDTIQGYVRWEKIKQHLYRKGYEWEVIHSLETQFNR